MSIRFGATVVVWLILMSVSVLGSTSVAHAQGTAVFKYPARANLIRSWDLTGIIRDGTFDPVKTDAGGPVRIPLAPGPAVGWSTGNWTTAIDDNLDVEPNPCIAGSFCYDSKKHGHFEVNNGPLRLLFNFRESSTDNLAIRGAGCHDPDTSPAPFYGVNEEVDYVNTVESIQPFTLQKSMRLWVRLSMKQTSLNVGNAVYNGSGQAKFEVWNDVNRNRVIDAADVRVFQHQVTTLVHNAMPDDSHVFPPGPYTFGKGNYIARLEVYHQFTSKLSGNLAVSDAWSDFVEDLLDVEASLR
jgi:hypothetical protein